MVSDTLRAIAEYSRNDRTEFIHTVQETQVAQQSADISKKRRRLAAAQKLSLIHISLAYLSAAWSGEPDVDMELAAHYCRLAYEAGFSPICPLLYLPLFLNDSVPEEHKAGIDMRRDIG